MPFPEILCYRSAMLKYRLKRHAAEAARIAADLASIAASVTALNDEDLLDLADIFAREASSPLRDMATTEMAKRNLKL